MAAPSSPPGSPADPGSGPRHPPARGEVREALLDAALTLVRRQGWASTSIDQLCRTVGVTKGAFFHHFGSKEELGVEAARHWSAYTSPLFANADYHRHADPLDRLFGYLDFRASLIGGPIEAFTCFAGTTLQETFATSEPIRAACGDSITAHIAELARDFAAAIVTHPPREPVTADSLAMFTQTVMQGAFVLSKATGDATPVHEGLQHLKRYLAQLFNKPDHHEE